MTLHDIVSSPCELGIQKLAEDVNESIKNPSKHFFENIWQSQPSIFHIRRDLCQDGCGLIQALNMGWNDIADLLHNSRQNTFSFDDPDTLDIAAASSPMLFFQQGKPVNDPHHIYNNNPHAAYLDGCSIIVNHADFHSSHVAQLCIDLQREFPHVYANSYLTPPNGFAVNAHADDRDVLVIQIMGCKTWKVYKNKPIEFPFANEQVGKNRLPVPPSVFEGGLCFDREVTLHPGDVIYIPRGFVHEATTETPTKENEYLPSFHLTVAIATHDWCLSVLLSETIRQKLDSITSFRKALPIGLSNVYGAPLSDNSAQSSSYLKQQLELAIDVIQSQVTAKLLEQNLLAKYDLHNTQSSYCRSRILTKTIAKKRKHLDCVGYDPASNLSLEDTIRLSTPEERNSVILEEEKIRGLTVRQETSETVLEILRVLNEDPSLRIKVIDLRTLVAQRPENKTEGYCLLCDFTLLSFARCCVEMGALAVV